MNPGDWFDIKVSPETLMEKAEEVREQAVRLQDDFRQLEEIISRTEGYWQGEAGDLHRSMYKGRKDQISSTLKRLQDFPTDLEKMAGVYSRAETENTELTGVLEGNAIV